MKLEEVLSPYVSNHDGKSMDFTGIAFIRAYTKALSSMNGDQTVL